MEFNHKIVPFKRDSAYLRQRALKNMRERNLLDAVELIRRAAEGSPDDPEILLDLARMYSEMGCHAQSNRILMDLFARDESITECLFGLAVNRFSMNDIEGARRTLRLYREKEGDDAAFSEDAQDLAVELGLYSMSDWPESRFSRRASSVSSRACDALQKDDYPSAQRLFARAIQLESDDPDQRALYALSLYLNEDTDGAREQVALAAAFDPQTVRSLCIEAQVYRLLDEQDACERAMRQAIAAHPDGIELKMLVFALGEMEMHRDAEDCARLALQDAPYDRELLHARAVAHFLDTGDAAAAAVFWTRILRVDPGDSIALYYCAASQSGALTADPPGYAYQVPEDEARRRLSVIAANLSPDIDELKRAWTDAQEFRSCITWAIMTDNPQLRQTAITTLAVIDDPAAYALLRSLMMEPSVPLDCKLHAVYLIRMRGADLASILPPDINPADGLLPDADSLLSTLPTDQRQLIRYASEVLEDDYGISALSALSVIWISYRQQRGAAADPLSRTESAAVALVYCYLSIHGKWVSPASLARRFRCSLRQVHYFIRRMETVLHLGEEEHNGKGN